MKLRIFAIAAIVGLVSFPHIGCSTSKGEDPDHVSAGMESGSPATDDPYFTAKRERQKALRESRAAARPANRPPLLKKPAPTSPEPDQPPTLLASSPRTDPSSPAATPSAAAKPAAETPAPDPNYPYFGVDPKRRNEVPDEVENTPP